MYSMDAFSLREANSFWMSASETMSDAFTSAWYLSRRSPSRTSFSNRSGV